MHPNNADKAVVAMQTGIPEWWTSFLEEVTPAVLKLCQLILV